MNEHRCKFSYDKTASSATIMLYGVWSNQQMPKEIDNFRDLIKNIKNKNVTIDVSNLTYIDTSGMTLLIENINKIKKQNISLSILEQSDNFKKIFSLVDSLDIKGEQISKKECPRIIDLVAKVGKITVEKLEVFIKFLRFLGQVTQAFIFCITHPNRFRMKTTLHFVEQTGINSLGIVSITSALIGVVITYQSIIILTSYGAVNVAVSIVSLSIMRELGPLIAGIVVGGKSSSSFTAEIGVMTITQEIDAMKTMGFSPDLFLVLPRIVALMITMPILVLFADTVALLGAMIIMKVQTGMEFLNYIYLLQESLEPKYLFIGLGKGFIFGVLIALIGTFKGLETRKNTESVGRNTTSSVVNTLFWIIVFNSIVSIILVRLNI